MSAENRVIRHKNKKNGVTYLYWGRSIYVPGQKHPKVENVFCNAKIPKVAEKIPHPSSGEKYSAG